MPTSRGCGSTSMIRRSHRPTPCRGHRSLGDSTFRRQARLFSRMESYVDGFCCEQSRSVGCVSRLLLPLITLSCPFRAETTRFKSCAFCAGLCPTAGTVTVTNPKMCVHFIALHTHTSSYVRCTRSCTALPGLPFDVRMRKISLLGIVPRCRSCAAAAA